MQNHSDLTIFDQNNSKEDLKRFRWIKWLYSVGVVGSIILDCFFLFIFFLDFKTIFIAINGFDLLSAILSIFYVYYPKSKISRSKVMKSILFISLIWRIKGINYINKLLTETTKPLICYIFIWSFFKFIVIIKIE